MNDNGNNLAHSFAGTDHNSGNFMGLTKREYFAGLAMQGVMTKNLVKLDIENGWEGAEVVAEMAVAAADALLAELAKTEKP